MMAEPLFGMPLGRKKASFVQMNKRRVRCSLIFPATSNKRTPLCQRFNSLFAERDGALLCCIKDRLCGRDDEKCRSRPPKFGVGLDDARA